MCKKLVAILSLCFLSTIAFAKPLVVVGIGNNFLDARHDAFRQAVEFKINTVVLSNRHHKNKQTILNEIIVHSSGYVDRYKILGTRNFSNRVEVQVEVEVSDSKIANRLTSPSDNLMILDGERHAAQRASFLEQIETGDKVLQSVLSDFPVKSFYVKVPYKPTFSLDNYGNSLITIPYFMVWNYEYLRALHEAIDVVYDGPKGYLPNLSKGARTEIQLRGTMFGNVFTRQQWYSFSNSRRVDMVKKVFDNSRPALKLTFYDNMNNILSEKCYDIDRRMGSPFYDFNTHTKVTIHGNQQLISSITDRLDFPIELVHKYDLTVIPINICGRA